MVLPTAAEREEVEDTAADPEPDPSPTRAPEPTPEPPAPSSTTSRSASTTSRQPTGVPNARQRQAVEETAADPSPAPEADPSPDQNEPTNSSSGASGNTETQSMVTDPIRNPDEELRAAAGADSGATGSEIMASGGGLVAAARSITGSGSAGGTPSGGTVRRLVFSGATDAPSDIISKMQGNGDPNPGHTTPQQANSPVTQTKNAAENATRSVAGVIPGVDASSSSTFVAVAAAAVVGTIALLTGLIAGEER